MTPASINEINKIGAVLCCNHGGRTSFKLDGPDHLHCNVISGQLKHVPKEEDAFPCRGLRPEVPKHPHPAPIPGAQDPDNEAVPSHGRSLSPTFNRRAARPYIFIKYSMACLVRVALGSYMVRVTLGSYMVIGSHDMYIFR